MKKVKINKPKKPKINITNLHKLPMNERLEFFNKLEEKFFKRFPKLKEELTMQNSRYDDVYTQREELVKLQFQIHRENIIKGKLPKGTRAFLGKIKTLSGGDIGDIAQRLTEEALNEYLEVIKAQSIEDYDEAVKILDRLSDSEKRRLVKEKGFFINHAYDSLGRQEFDTWIDDNKGDYRTDTIELYKLKYFEEHKTLKGKAKLNKMSKNQLSKKGYKV